MLSTLLSHADDDAQTGALARDGGRAFVSQSLRPYLLAALLDRDPATPAIVVAGDDRAARDLAAGLKTWLEPRNVRYYPSRGVTYESHLAPPPHLVGLRIAALDALLEEPGESAPVVVVSAVALSEKVPDPELRPHAFCLKTGDLLDLDETAMDLVAAGYERTDQVEDRGQFAIRGGLLDVFPATEDRAVRVDLFGDEIDLPIGEIRPRLGGGLAGHNGLKSLKAGLGSADFTRVRIGVGRPPTTDPDRVAAYVLGRFREPNSDVRALIDDAADVVERTVVDAEPAT